MSAYRTTAKCPICRSVEIKIGRYEQDDRLNDHTCNDCGHRWQAEPQTPVWEMKVDKATKTMDSNLHLIKKVFLAAEDVRDIAAEQPVSDRLHDAIEDLTGLTYELMEKVRGDDTGLDDGQKT